MNQTSTKAVEGMTPYEAAFGKKPNLRDVHEWGEKVWVRVEGGNKLGGRVREGRLMGIDEQSKGIRIYWPDKMTVGIEHNVYYDKSTASVSRIEGEEGIIEMKTDLPNSTNPTSNIPSDNPTPTPPHKPNSSTSEDDLPEKRIRKPSQRIVDIIEGHGSTSNWPSDPIVARGVQLPPPLPPVTEQPPNKVFEGEGQAEWIMAADFAEEYSMLAEISKTEAFEPRTLTKAKSRPDWPLWERAIEEELETLRKAGTWELTEPPPEANIVGSKWVF